MRLSLPSIVAAGALIAAGPLLALAQDAKPRPAPVQTASRIAPIVVVRLNGDLVATRLVSRLREELDGAAQSKAELVILTIEGYRWRADVARALADVVAASKVPVAALLGPASPLGGGQALVAMSANTTWIATMASIRWEAGDEVVVPAAANAAVTPEPSPAADILTRRALPVAMAGVLLAPSTPTYAAWDGPEGALALHEGAAPDGGAALVTRTGSGVQMRIPADLAVKLGIAKSTASNPGAILRAMSLRASTVTTRLVAEDLAARKAELHAQLNAAKTLTSQAADRMASSPRGNDPADFDKRRRAGQAAATTCQRAGEALAKAESLAKEFPELLVEPPPGATGVGATPKTSVKAWVAAFKDAQDDLAKAAQRAARAAESTR